MACTAIAHGNKGAAKTSSTSPLLELPAELRNLIYREVLVVESPIETEEYMRDIPVARIQLLHVCRQIREEARGIFWGQNKFQHTTHGSYNPDRSDSFWKVGEENLSLIRHFDIELLLEQEFRESLEFNARMTNPSFYATTIDLRWVSLEIHGLLLSGLPLSSIDLWRPCLLSGSLTCPLDRKLAKIKEEFYENITTTIAKSAKLRGSVPIEGKEVARQVFFEGMRLIIRDYDWSEQTSDHSSVPLLFRP